MTRFRLGSVLGCQLVDKPLTSQNREGRRGNRSANHSDRSVVVHWTVSKCRFILTICIQCRSCSVGWD